MFIHDIYHEQRIIKAGIVPAAQVFVIMTAIGPQCTTLSLPRADLCPHSGGIDLIRHGDGGLLCAGRAICAHPLGRFLYAGRAQSSANRCCPKCLPPAGTAGEQLSAAALRHIGRLQQHDDSPNIVVLTPRPLQQRLLRHTFWRGQSNVPSVHGYDLFVEDNIVTPKPWPASHRVGM